MGKMKSFVLQRSWRILRLALLWARKGGALRRSLMMELRVLPNYIKSLRHVHHHQESIHYREKEFSFDETPLFNFKMHHPSSLRFIHLPCIKPQVDFDYEYEYDFNGRYGNEDKEEDTVCQIEARESYEEDERMNNEIVVVEDESIDDKAEEFIANFYRQMKMQRQV